MKKIKAIKLIVIILVNIKLNSLNILNAYYLEERDKFLSYSKEINNSYTKYTSINYHIKYYSQNNPLWGNKFYNISNLYNTGCVPTALSMIISTLKYDTYPDTIADDLYRNTTYFNKKDIGTSASGTGYILKKYGLNYRLIYNFEQLKLELSKGNIVYAAVGNKPFTINGYTHAVLLRGIDSSGNTTVYNPYSNFGWKKVYNTKQIWAQRSRVKEDNELGSPFIVIDA